MQNLKKRKSTKYIVVSIVAILCIAIALISGMQSFDGVENIAPIIPTANATLNNTYGAFSHGSIYKYTDYTKIDGVQAGTITDDTTTVTVDSTKNHGEQENPFVIDSVSVWNAFVADMADTSNGITDYGKSSYFVLAKDLNFSGSTFNRVMRFNGTFYGLGHTISNIALANLTGNGYAGIFGFGYGFTITDLNNDNYTYTNTKGYVGGIVGCAIEDYKILNCHTKGTVTGSTQTTDTYHMGGITGFSSGGDGIASTVQNVKQIIYRCSVDMSVSGMRTTSTDAVSLGGMTGVVWHKSAPVMYGCYANVKVSSYNLTNEQACYSGIAGAISEAGALHVENCVQNLYIDNVNSTKYPMLGFIGAIWLDDTAYQTQKIKVKDAYFVAYGGSSSGANVTLSPITNYNYQDPQVYDISYDFNNVNFAGNGSLYGYTSPVKATLAASYTNMASDINALWAAATGINSALSAAIWDKSVLSSTYAYTIATSPVINKLQKEQFDVEFLNYETSGDKGLGVSSIKYDYGDTPIALATPTAPANHTFVGWTIDKTDKQTPFTTLPDNIYGNVKLYAVWDNPNTTAAISLVNSKTGDSTNTLEYGTGNIKLKASASGTGMDPNKTFKWYKAGETKEVETDDTCTLTTVKQSGTYSFEYTLQDKNEPLWRHKGTSSTQVVTITPGQLHLDTFSIKSTTPAYFGIELRYVSFDVTVKDNGNNTVAGSARWEVPGDPVKDGVNDTYKIIFTPTDEDNYDESELLVEFDSDYVTLTFDMKDSINREVVVNLEYAQDYSNTKIINMFLDEFRKRIVEPTDPMYDPTIHTFDANFKNKENSTPTFDGVEITKYKGEIKDAKTKQTIVVDFINKDYTVTFDAKNGSANVTQMHKFNKFLTEPLPKPTYSGKIFLGWFNDDDKDTAGNAHKWDFLNDRVKGDTTLTAHWFQATLTLESIEIKSKYPTGYTALTVLQDADIIVIAHYTTDSPDYPTYDEQLVMGGSGYTLTYESSDNMLHVSYPGITATYTYDGVTESDTVALSVNPIKLDLSTIVFKDKVDVFDGSVKSIDKINLGRLPVQLIDVDYVYSQGGRPVDEADVIAVGVYNVTAKFISSDPDYGADDKTATLTIKRAAQPLTVTWDTTNFSYNAKAQHPKAILKDADGNDVTDFVDFHYEGDDDATAVGNRYNIQVVLDDPTYMITNNDSTSFSIVKAVLDAPTLNNGNKIIYNGTTINVSDYLDGFDGDIMNIVSGGSGTNAGTYHATIELPDMVNCEWRGISGNSILVDWTIEKAHLTALWDSDTHVADGNEYQPRVTSLSGLATADNNAIDYDNDFIYTGDIGKSASGAYTVSVEVNDNALWKDNYILDGNTTWAYAIVPKAGMEVITIEWQDTDLTFNGKVQMPEYIVKDKDGNDITDQVKGMLTFGGDYDKSKWADDYTLTVNQLDDKYFIKSGLTCDYTINIDENGNGYNPNAGDEEGGSGGLSFDNVGEMLKQWWQVFASGISIVLIVLFLAKAASNESRRKKADKIATERYKSYYAGAVGLFGIAMTSWTVIACVLMGLAAVSFVIMLITGSRRAKAEDNLAYSREQAEKEEARQRDENMRMMLMGLMGGNNGGNMGAQGGYAYAQPGIGAEDIRGIISETVTALLPGVQQALPQQASTNDELVNRLIEQNEKLMEKLAEQQPVERVVEKEVVATTVNDETIKQMMKNQEILMEKILELSANQKETQIIEKVVQPQVQVVEKEVPVEKIVEKIVEVPVEVEKIVEKEVVKEVKVEVPVIKEVKVKAEPKPKKEVAPRLTLDEAYALLSKTQQKYFDGLRQYALSKPGCKEKKSTYAITIGQSTVNPLLKLTIKKDMTVALFKMEDEYLKDIKRDASGDGTKIKVKETEVIISDAQACKAAKNMIDLREDQIERYNELLKEQRAMKRK